MRCVYCGNNILGGTLCNRTVCVIKRNREAVAGVEGTLIDDILDSEKCEFCGGSHAKVLFAVSLIA